MIVFFPFSHFMPPSLPSCEGTLEEFSPLRFLILSTSIPLCCVNTWAVISSFDNSDYPVVMQQKMLAGELNYCVRGNFDYSSDLIT